MGLFRHGKVTQDSNELDAIRAEVARLASALRTLETEQTLMHQQVRTWMRRAVAAERRAEGGAQQEPAEVRTAPDHVEEPPPPRMTMWGARRRIAERRGRVESVNGGE